MARSPVAKGVNDSMHKKPLICIASVAKTLHRISFLVIESTVYLYIHYLLSHRAKGLRSQSFVGDVDKGKAPKSVWYIGLMTSILKSQRRRLGFGASYAWKVVKHAMYII